MSGIVEKGPLVAFFDRAERHHRWVTERVEALEGPLLVCEPVLTETIYLLARYSRAQDALLDLLQDRALSIAFRIADHVGELRRLLQNTGIRRCLWPMHASCAWPRSMSGMLC